MTDHARVIARGDVVQVTVYTIDVWVLKGPSDASKNVLVGEGIVGMHEAIRRFHEAREAGLEEVVIWGTGTPRREFLHVDDMAEASLFVMELSAETYAANTQPMLSHVNVGSGVDVSILELSQLVAKVTGFQGRIATDPTKPDGTPRKLMDVSRLAEMGWSASTPLEEGVRETYQWFLQNLDTFRE